MIIKKIKNILSKIKFYNIDRLYIVERLVPIDYNDNPLKIFNQTSLNYDIKQITEFNSPMMEKYMEFNDGIKKENILEWLSDGNICCLAMHEEMIIGSLWLTTKYYSYNELRRVKSKLQGTANIIKLFVTPQYRRKGIGSQLIMHVLQDASLRNYKKATGIVRCNNYASLRMFEKLNFEITHKLYIVKIGLFIFHHLRNCQNTIKRNDTKQ